MNRFENFSRHYEWTSDGRLFQLQTALTGVASQLLWDLPPEASAEQVIHLMKVRFGTVDQAESFRAELRNQKRGANETLSNLYIDICRLMSLAFPGPPSATSEIVGHDAFLNALDDEDLRVRTLEQNPQTLDAAVM